MQPHAAILAAMVEGDGAAPGVVTVAHLRRVAGDYQRGMRRRVTAERAPIRRPVPPGWSVGILQERAATIDGIANPGAPDTTRR